MGDEGRSMRIPRDRAFRRALRRFHRPWYRRLLPWAFFFALLLVAGRVALTPAVEHWSRTTMAALPGFRASYRSLDVFTWPPVYVLDGVRVETAAGEPVLSIERLEVHTRLREIVAAALGQRPAI